MKTILVFDEMPNCWDCPCADDEYDYCRADKVRRKILSKERQPWCPVKPLPKKLDAEDSNEPWYTEYRLCDGWNECLDEIEKEPHGSYKSTGMPIE